MAENSKLGGRKVEIVDHAVNKERAARLIAFEFVANCVMIRRHNRFRRREISPSRGGDFLFREKFRPRAPRSLNRDLIPAAFSTSINCDARSFGSRCPNFEFVECCHYLVRIE